MFYAIFIFSALDSCYTTLVMEEITPISTEELTTPPLQIVNFALTEFCLEDMRDIGVTEIIPNLAVMRSALDFINEERGPIDPALAFIARTTTLGARGRDVRWPARRNADMSSTCYDIQALTRSDEADKSTLRELAEQLGAKGVKTICELDFNPASSQVITMESLARSVLMNRRPAIPTQSVDTQGGPLSRSAFAKQIKRLTITEPPFTFVRG